MLTSDMHTIWRRANRRPGHLGKSSNQMQNLRLRATASNIARLFIIVSTIKLIKQFTKQTFYVILMEANFLFFSLAGSFCQLNSREAEYAQVAKWTFFYIASNSSFCLFFLRKYLIKNCAKGLSSHLIMERRIQSLEKKSQTKLIRNRVHDTQKIFSVSITVQ